MHSRNVYVLTRSHRNRLQNLGVNKCVRCNITFAEKDVIATSTSNRYCYECAKRINLVSGNAKKDLGSDKFVLNIQNQVKSLTKKHSIEKEISSLAVLLLKAAFEKSNYVTKNPLGLSCAALSLASKLLGQTDNFWNDSPPVSPNVIVRNISQLQKVLNGTSITSISQNIQEVKS